MAQVITIGEILVEIMATELGQTFLEPGLFAGPYPSGAPAIFADQAGRMGASVAIVACVGPDPFGALNIERLRASGVDVSAIRELPGTVTGSAFVAYRADGSRDFVFNIAASAAGHLTPEQLDPTLFRDCRCFHVMGSSLIAPGVTAAVRRGCALARAAGALVSFDPNVRKELLALPGVAATLDEMLASCDLALPSEADLAHFFPGLADEAAAARLVAAGRRLVVVKRGARGCLCLDAERRLELPAFPAQEVDPTGAGDCFGGTFVAGLVLGLPVERALELAAAAGALAVTRRGPMAGNATRAELEAFLARQGLRR
jgi:fructokinase